MYKLTSHESGLNLNALQAVGVWLAVVGALVLDDTLQRLLNPNCFGVELSLVFSVDRLLSFSKGPPHSSFSSLTNMNYESHCRYVEACPPCSMNAVRILKRLKKNQIFAQS